MIPTPNIKLYATEDLQQCSTLEQVTNYFNEVNFTTIEQKHQALLEATNSSQMNYFNKNISKEQEFEILLDMFLDEDFRFLRGI